MTTFNELNLDALLLKALETEGYSTPTPIQRDAIPGIMAGRDLLGIAQTGTGKTAAFALPILHRLMADRRPALRRGARALVLSPTRELASQIAESFKAYGRHTGLKVTTVFGGVGMRPQIQALAAGVDVLVATPGRLIDHMQERTVTLEGTEILVLDEADQMMDLGFIRPLRQIISRLPSRRQSLFFSATMPHEIGALAAELLRDPLRVEVTPVAKTADRVAQKVILIEQQRKRAILIELLANPDFSRTLVFTRTKRGADRVARALAEAGIPSAAIHGNKSQGQREQALAAFKASKVRALIATDIAARGIDIDAVSHVINYEIPNVPESYVHRIGRTARAGAEGIAISLVDAEERTYLRDIERLTRQTIPHEDRRGDMSLAAVEAPAQSAPRSAPDARPGRFRNGAPAKRDDRRDDRRNDRRGERHGRGGSGQPRAAQSGQNAPQGSAPQGPDSRPHAARGTAERGSGRPQDRRHRHDRPDRHDRHDRHERHGVREDRQDRPGAPHTGREHAPSRHRDDGRRHGSDRARADDAGRRGAREGGGIGHVAFLQGSARSNPHHRPEGGRPSHERPHAGPRRQGR